MRIENQLKGVGAVVMPVFEHGNQRLSITLVWCVPCLFGEDASVAHLFIHFDKALI